MAQEECPTRKEQLVAILNAWTPLAAVLQDLVASYLEGPTTLFVADYRNHVIRAVNLQDFSVRVFAGQPKPSPNGGHADGGAQAAAQFIFPYCIAVDKATNTLLVCERSCIRRVTADGVVSTLCGDPHERGYREGVGTEARFNSISGCVVVGRSLYICEYQSHCVRRIPLDASTTTQLFAGTPGEVGLEDGTNAKFYCPNGIAVDSTGTLFVADRQNHCIRMITPKGVVSTLSLADFDEYSDALKLRCPVDVAFDGQGRLLCSSMLGRSLLLVDLKASSVTNVPLHHSAFFIAANLATGDVFSSNCINHTIQRLSSDGSVMAVCGTANQAGCQDGMGTQALFNNPSGLVLH